MILESMLIWKCKSALRETKTHFLLQLRGQTKTMAKAWAKPFYRSVRWKKCRQAYFNSQYGICEWCGRPGRIVDHIVELTPNNINNQSIATDWTNLQVLCMDCHNKKTFAQKNKTQHNLKVVFDEEGNPVGIPPSKK